MPRGQMDPETRQRVLEMAWAAKKEKAMARAQRKEEGVKGLRTERDFYAEDRETWATAARVEGVRLPSDWTEPCTTARMHNFLTKAGIPKQKYNEWWGMNIKQTIDANPEWPLRAWAGIVVEHLQAILES
jgi:hypothetical protein